MGFTNSNKLTFGLFNIGIQPFAAVEIFLHALHTRAHFFSLILRLGFEFFVVRNN